MSDHISVTNLLPLSSEFTLFGWLCELRSGSFKYFLFPRQLTVKLCQKRALGRIGMLVTGSLGKKFVVAVSSLLQKAIK